ACYTCGKFGHFKSNCPQGKGGKKHPEQGGPSQKREFVGVTECNAVMIDNNDWWIDSGSTRHIAKMKNGLVILNKLKPEEKRVYMGNNTYLEVEGVGTYRLDLGDTGMVLQNVFYAPAIRRNLISVPALVKNKLEVRFYNNRVSIEKDKEVLAMGKFVPEHDLFCIPVVSAEINEIGADLNYSSCYLSEYDLWYF